MLFGHVQPAKYTENNFVQSIRFKKKTIAFLYTIHYVYYFYNCIFTLCSKFLTAMEAEMASILEQAEDKFINPLINFRKDQIGELADGKRETCR